MVFSSEKTYPFLCWSWGESFSTPIIVHFQLKSIFTNKFVIFIKSNNREQLDFSKINGFQFQKVAKLVLQGSFKIWIFLDFGGPHWTLLRAACLRPLCYIMVDMCKNKSTFNDVWVFHFDVVFFLSFDAFFIETYWCVFKDGGGTSTSASEMICFFIPLSILFILFSFRNFREVCSSVPDFKYRWPSLYAVFLSAISRICDWELAIFWNLSSNLQSSLVF